MDTFLEFSKFSINAKSSNISPSALANLYNNSSSNSFNLILYEFYYYINSTFFYAKSGLSLPTTNANN